MFSFNRSSLTRNRHAIGRTQEFIGKTIHETARCENSVSYEVVAHSTHRLWTCWSSNHGTSPRLFLDSAGGCSIVILQSRLDAEDDSSDI
jgi:hypothetical protein